MSSSFILQKFLSCLICLIWMAFEIGGWWPYSFCFVECFLQDIFNTSCSILVQLLSSNTFSQRLRGASTKAT